MALKNRLKQIRGDISQKELSIRLDVSLATLQRYEYGDRTPGADFIAAFCKEFEINADWLLTGEGPMKNGGEGAGLGDETDNSPQAQSEQEKGLSFGDGFELLHRIYTSGNPVFIRAINNNLFAFVAAIEEKARSDKAESRIEQLESKLSALEDHLNEMERKEKNRIESEGDMGEPNQKIA